MTPQQSPCPQCAGALQRIVEYPEKHTGTILIVLGVVLTPLCGLGLPFVIIGMSMAQAWKARWHCVACGRSYPDIP